MSDSDPGRQKITNVRHGVADLPKVCVFRMADEQGLARVRPLLEALGRVRPVGDASTAAALKLVANSSLAGAVLALRDSLQQGGALSLPQARAKPTSRWPPRHRRSAMTYSARCALTSAGTPPATRPISARRSCPLPTSRGYRTERSSHGASRITARS